MTIARFFSLDFLRSGTTNGDLHFGPTFKSTILFTELLYRSLLSFFLIVLTLFAVPKVSAADSRIKVYTYSKNQVYLLTLHYGFQSSIELAKGEEVMTITLGDNFAWKITPVDNILFIKPMERNIRTNMTIITNKRVYQFDLVSEDLEPGKEENLVYVIKFCYPKNQSMKES
ncbi:TrbG/VirB9 family P-type conjugative transfer protein [Candidatus Sarmatiella mevalonica]|uniref:TrbG/VirB9 family P-type conjugative transfer protein n=1 Tax=Candidatus Sarmatiella mevalonica TaxID=2770581 RepID=UPI001922E9FC